jgi:hypothetical protein
MESESVPHRIIRQVRLAHCKRGPSRCEKCREMDVERICLLNIDPPQQGRLQRRVIQVRVDGVDVWREFDVVRAFESEAEARAYADAHGIVDVELQAEPTE